MLSLFLVIPNQKDGRKLEMLVWRVIARYLRKLEEFKTQSSYRYITKPQRQLTGLKSNTDKNANLIFLSAITLFFLTKDNHSKTNLFVLKLV